jgi:hypothetical protein
VRFLPATPPKLEFGKGGAFSHRVRAETSGTKRMKDNRFMIRSRRSWMILSAIFGGSTVFTHCSTTVEDAVLDGVSIVITDVTVEVLEGLLPFDLGGSGGSGGGGGGSNGDPFGDPPVQT